MAASSSTTQTRPRYDVFLSFKGADTRTGFVDHLHTALVDAGFRTFRDVDVLERGENINPEQEKPIKDSKCSVIVFSKDYASSVWCLDELVTILELKKTSNHVVLPVFYYVEPSDVWDQTGSFAESFARHEEHFEEDINKVNGWRKALKEAAELAGMMMNDADRREAEFIKKMINVVKEKLRSIP